MFFEEIFSNDAMTVQRDRLRLPVQINLEKPIAFSIKFPCMEKARVTIYRPTISVPVNWSLAALCTIVLHM